MPPSAPWAPPLPCGSSTGAWRGAGTQGSGVWAAGRGEGVRAAPPAGVGILAASAGFPTAPVTFAEQPQLEQLDAFDQFDPLPAEFPSPRQASPPSSSAAPAALAAAPPRRAWDRTPTILSPPLSILSHSLSALAFAESDAELAAALAASLHFEHARQRTVNAQVAASHTADTGAADTGPANTDGAGVAGGKVEAKAERPCAICLREIEEEELALVSMCDHPYCLGCILRW
ncbi:hypothetical protein T492DRAFT_841775 [Pavlovales sp. CCMP2436]|nr:hypothetical protein T492DRAFT_841775 [Pavlovales sp. CCMP2436]